ncbi:class I alpha-mannosidase 1A [Ophiocordyceps camponoti-floridani]|uniref:alpha-1,2-Mannosidase n=1 Tax=Ophiocordyceps camponoti-floridani TaxID=2030778 RepID=A0A8H4Q7N8_9HYPO|nr:class I alpha-mannosidase 1A [Ophiocordyceps camponoti-floridani]
MLRRKYRLLSVCAFAIVLLLYRLSTNSPQPDIATAPAAEGVKPPPAVHPGVDQADFAEAPAPYALDKKPLDERPGFVPKQEPDSGAVDPAKPSDATKLSDGESDSKSRKEITLDAAARDPITGDEAPLLTWKNPPKHSDVVKSADEVHWIKPKEHYPLRKSSVITLPTGPAKDLPRVQFAFPPESAQAKVKRLERRKRVKTELERSWSGYKKHAWLHDELSPVSGGFRDPFCGWAATLIDSLDTLWIADMKDEFGKAVEAVETIDFTRARRSDIPVFETTIRYLGGLIAAFDVSEGPRGGYSILLNKAVELADILMGIFDTPNRMPVLYYQWKPEYASQPHMAGQVGMAELATLSLEFTRLAQLTSQHKYYDAVARITNALEAMQKEGTLIPGLFPESLDASGCNRTATRLENAMSRAAQKQIESQGLISDTKGFGEYSNDQKVVRDPTEEGKGARSGASASRLERRDGLNTDDTSFRASSKSNSWQKGPYKADGIKADWDCVAQGLVPGGFGLQKFHMGGGQDSAYEYFGKEYQLLRGREPKYKKLYEDAADAIDKYLLYRPMIEGQWDALFPAKVSVSSQSADDLLYHYEVTHLTCFIGGMFGLGGKLFSRPDDIETAKKLTDGCVWAYQATASGIMPDGGTVVPCPSMDRCEFNKTRWWELLDGSKDWRDDQVRKWEEQYGDAASENSKDLGKRAAMGVPEVKGAAVRETRGSQLPESLRVKLGKKYGVSSSQTKVTTDGTSRDSSQGAKESIPKRPMSHEEYVKMILDTTKLPPGYLPNPSAVYLLRPEAIESVWYMYRITGDPTWMDKGWRMFEATVRATRTSIANSAVSDVLSKEPQPKDEMESFWMAETLKYYYLLFSEPDLISLDEWVLNTEAHPFKL